MTDEQCIDVLFSREGIGWEKTPGFRSFVLDLMGIIGERPRAGDVCSMHMAYRAGMEQSQARTWTTDRPTQPGEYWLAVHPDQRLHGMHGTLPVNIAEDRDIEPYFCVRALDGGCMGRLSAAWLDGALWAPRETPADPFEEVGT